MAQRHELEIEDPALVLPHPAYANSVSPAQISVQSRLRSVVLVEDLDGRVRRGWASQGFRLALVVPQGLLDFLRGGRWPALELQAHAGSVAVQDRHAVARRRDLQALLLHKRRLPIVHAAQDLPRLRLQLILLAGDERHHVVDHVHARHAGVPCAGDSLHGHDADGGDGPEDGLQRGEGDDEPDDGAVGVADEEALGEAALGALVGDEVEVREVDGGDDEGDEGIATVVFRVGEDGDFGLGEFDLWVLSVLHPPMASTHHPHPPPTRNDQE